MIILIKYDDVLYHSILSINNFLKNKNTTLKIANNWNDILIKNKISFKNDYFEYLVEGIKQLEKGQELKFEKYDFNSFEHSAHSTRTQIHIFSINYRKSYTY